MTTRWQNLLNGPDAARTGVFSGGACNAIDAVGDKVRNVGRDALNDWLNEQGILFFDPQIHEDTHGRGYDYDIDGPAEQQARQVAKVTLYEVTPDTLGGVTCLEVLRDVLSDKQVVLWFSGPSEAFDAKGRAKFTPAIDLSNVDGLAAIHLAQYVDAGTKLRANLMAFIKGRDNVIIVRSLEEAQRAITEKLNS
jgi:hypothetical protein